MSWGGRVQEEVSWGGRVWEQICPPKGGCYQRLRVQGTGSECATPWFPVCLQDGDACPVCFEMLHAHNMVELDCGHEFHTEVSAGVCAEGGSRAAWARGGGVNLRN